METEGQVNVDSRLGSPKFPVIELKIEPKEENDFQFDQLKVASWSEDEKYNINLHKDFDSSIAKGSCTEDETGVFKNEPDESNASCDHKNIPKFEFIELEEVHIKQEIKHEAEEDLLNKKEQKLEDYQCPECPYRSSNKFNLTKHSSKHKNPDEVDWYCCQECPYKTYRKWDLKIHTETHNSLMLKCSKCSFKTRRETSLRRHEIEHKPNIQWLHCPECSFKTRLRSRFQSHSLIHKSDTFKCSSCPYQTGNKDLFTKHQLKHETSDNWYVCPLCSFQTPAKSLLRIHCRRSHNCDPNNPEQIEIFKCTECSYQSGCKNTMKRHQLGHDPNNWLQCPDCAYRTFHKCTMKQHRLRHQGENAEGWHRCLKCPYKTPYKYDLRKHILIHDI